MVVVHVVTGPRMAFRLCSQTAECDESNPLTFLDYWSWRMIESAEPLDVESPIPYTLTPLGKAELTLERIRSWRNEALKRAEYRAFVHVCEDTFTPEELESLLS